MGRIIEMKFKAKVVRDDSGHVTLEVDKDSGVELKKDKEVEVESHQIIGLTKEISDFNQKEISTAKNSLFNNEDLREVEIIEKKLVD